MNDLVNCWEIHVLYLDSAGHDIYEHWTNRRYTVFAGTLEAAFALVHEREGAHRHQIVEAQSVHFSSGILGLGDGLENLARTMHPDGLLMDRKCRLGHHKSCYGKAHGLLPDGKWDRPCECPCHKPIRAKKRATP